MHFLNSAIAEVKAELKRVGGSNAIGLYLTIIEEGAIRALQQS